MNLFDFLILGIVIGSNNFAVALALGALGQIGKRWRIMIVFGTFEFFIPLAGIWLGVTTARIIGLHSNIIGAVMLCILGIISVIGSMRNGDDDKNLTNRVTSWGGLIILSATLSLDNLLVGISIGLSDTEPLLLAATIAFFALIFTWLGIELGSESRRRWECIAKITAGLLLILVGLAVGFGML